MNPRYKVVGACLALLACGHAPDKQSGGNTDRATGRPEPPSSIVRLARTGGKARVYALPSLEDGDWQSNGPLPAIDTMLGVDYEQHLVFALDRKRNVFALDLASGRTRVYLSQVRLAALGPDMSLYAVDTASGVVQLTRRSPVQLAGRLRALPTGMFGTLTGELLAVERGEVAMLGSSAARTLPVPPGIVTATFWGDLIAVATDTGVVMIDPQRKRATSTVAGAGHPRALLFSPSGHRLYVTGTDAEVVVIDRFARTVQRRIALPGPARALRSDFFGNWLLVQPASGDSVWIVDLNSDRVVLQVAAEWGSDLPAAAGANELVVRRGKDVVGLELRGGEAHETGRVAGGAADLWVPVVWSPAAPEAAVESTADTARITSTPSRAPAADTTNAPATVPAATRADSSAAAPAIVRGSALYLQVSSSLNPTWANDLAAKLRVAGLTPTVLKPAGAEESYRVVIGPFKSRDEADEAGRKLGMPSFVITVQSDSTP